MWRVPRLLNLILPIIVGLIEPVSTSRTVIGFSEDDASKLMLRIKVASNVKSWAYWCRRDRPPMRRFPSPHPPFRRQPNQAVPANERRASITCPLTTGNYPPSSPPLPVSPSSTSQHWPKIISINLYTTCYVQPYAASRSVRCLTTENSISRRALAPGFPGMNRGPTPRG